MPDYVQLPLWKPYDPQVNDYVIWDRGEYGRDEGWVYFKGDVPVHKRGFPDRPRYITIETNVFLSGGSLRKIAPRIADSIGAVAIITKVFATLVFCIETTKVIFVPLNVTTYISP